jgi:hypothetical protein
MMFSQMSIDDQISETEMLVDYVVATILAWAPNREMMLLGLKDLRYFEDDLRRLEELKKHDRNH